MNYRYITLFDIIGFESIIDISADDAAKAEAAIKDELQNLEKNINSLTVSMLFRARANSQRYPEVWVFWSEVPQNILWESAQESPQMMANLIRERGECLYKAEKPPTIII